MIFERVKRLPEPLAREVLDFAALLETRGDRETAGDLVAAQAGPLRALWNTPEDKVWDEV